MLKANLDTENDYEEYGFSGNYRLTERPRLFFGLEYDFSLVGKTYSQLRSKELDYAEFFAGYTIYKSAKSKTTVSLGYATVFGFEPLNLAKNQFRQDVYNNPFVSAAKRFGKQFRASVMAGPMLKSGAYKNSKDRYRLETTLDYKIPKTKAEIGVEVEKNTELSGLSMYVRPQVNIAIDKYSSVGVVTQFSVNQQEESGTLLRFIFQY